MAVDHDADLIFRLRKVIDGQGLSIAAMTKEIRERDAEITTLKSALIKDEEMVSLFDAHLDVSGDAKERAERFMAKRRPYVADAERFTEHLARALQQYGDEREAAATEAERRRCATIDHIDIDLIRREAREAAIEEERDRCLRVLDMNNDNDAHRYYIRHPEFFPPRAIVAKPRSAGIIGGTVHLRDPDA